MELYPDLVNAVELILVDVVTTGVRTASVYHKPHLPWLISILFRFFPEKVSKCHTEWQDSANHMES
jgi:hypothetical protein